MKVDLKEYIHNVNTRTPHIRLVPKDFDENLAFRKEVIKYGSESRENAADLWQMCAEDVLFFTNVFCWLQEPRDATALPFITYDFQDDLIVTLNDSIGKTDVHIEKSRDMGASWCGLLLATWRFIFHPNQAILMASQNEDLVDKTGDPKSIFWKIDYILKNLPGWLKPKVDRISLHFGNEDNGSTIDGSATKRDLDRGGRRTFIWLDEFASFNEKEAGMDVAVMSATRDNTRSRFFCSTHKGKGTEFYKIKEDTLEGKRDCVLKRLHWEQHPLKNVGKYKLPNGKYTSPWRDEQIRRSANPIEIAQEVDIDVLASDYQFFDYPEPMIDGLEREFGRRPVWRGEIEVDPDSGKFIRVVEAPNGSFSLWEPIPSGGRFEGHYSVCCDVAVGTGATNSIAAIVDRNTARQVGEWANRRTPPREFAVIAVGLCDFFDNAFMVWEHNGPGQDFADKVIQTGFRNFYYRRKSEKITNDVTDAPGWWSSDKLKLNLLLALKDALKTGAFTIRSTDAYRECREMVYKQNGGVEHQAESVSQDPSGAGANHADRVIALGLAYMSIKERPPYEVKKEKVLSENTLAGRRAKREREAEEENEDSFVFA